MKSTTSFGTWVQQQRKTLDWTQAELATNVGCALVTIRKIEQDLRRPSRQLAELLAKQLQIPTIERDYFIAVARGQDLPVGVELTAVSPVSSLPTDLPPQQSITDMVHFVGRQRELLVLEQAMTHVAAGQGQVRFVTGEAGRGKTSLLLAFAQQAQRRQHGLIVAGGSCNAFAGTGDPYLPFRDILATLTGEVDPRWAHSIADRQRLHLWHYLPQMVGTILDCAPDLLNVLTPSAPLLQRLAAHFPTETALHQRLEAVVQQQHTRPTNPDQRQLFEQVRHLLQTVTTHSPLLLLLDDLQWADNASLNLLFHLVQRMHNCRLFILGAYRASEIALLSADEPAKPPHPLWTVTTELKRHWRDIELDLEQSSPAENRAFVEALLDSETNQLNRQFRDRLFAQTRGYPLFTTELLRALQEQGSLVRNADGEWMQGESLNWAELPTRVEAAIAQRIGRLPAALQEILRVAGVEGEIFTAEVVAHVLDTDVTALIQQLSRLLNRQFHLIEPQGSQRLGTQLLSQYKFRHILFQRYLHHELDEVTRVHMHEAVAGALEILYGEHVELIAPQLAAHYEAANIAEKATDYLLVAGRHAVRVSAHVEAIRHLQQGITLLTALPSSRKRNQKELEFQMLLGVPLGATRDYSDPEVEAAYRRALTLCQQLQRAPSAPILRGLAILSLLRGEYRQAHGWATQLLAVAEQTEDTMYLVEAHYALGVNYFWLGALARSRHHLEAVLARYVAQNHAAHIVFFIQDPFLICQQRLGYTLWHLGYPDQAVAAIRKAVQHAQALNHPFSLAYVYAFTAWFYVDYRDWEQAQHFAQLAMTYAGDNDISYWHLIGEIYWHWLQINEKDRQAGIADTVVAMQRFRARGLGVGWPFMCARLAEAYGQNGQATEALAVIDEGLRCADQQEERWCIPELYHVRGEIFLQQANGNASIPAQAEESFQAAIAAAQEIGAKTLELRATISLCRLWHQQGKIDDAHNTLATVYNWFTEGFATPDLREAKALLQQLNGSAAKTQT